MLVCCAALLTLTIFKFKIFHLVNFRSFQKYLSHIPVVRLIFNLYDHFPVKVIHNYICTYVRYYIFLQTNVIFFVYVRIYIIKLWYSNACL